MDLKKEKESYILKIENATEEEIKNRSFSFSLFSANVKKFLPNIADSEYQDLFKKFLYFSKNLVYCPFAASINIKSYLKSSDKFNSNAS